MKQVKKIGLRVLAVVVVLGAVYIGFNQLDAPPARFEAAGDLDTSSLENLTKGLIKPPSFEKTNGYYRLWSLPEPPGTDIEADEQIMKYRRLHDPQFDNDKYIKEWNGDEKTWGFKKDYKGPFETYSEKRKKMLDEHGTFDSFAGAGTRDWTKLILSKKEIILELKSLYQAYLDRYQVLLDTDFFEDFTLIRFDTTIPHLLAWLQIGRLYNTVNMLEALEGNWEKGVSAMLNQVNFAKKAIKTGRTLIFNLVAKAIMRESLHGLAALMNEAEFPKALYEKVIQGLPPLRYEEFGSRVPLLIEGWGSSQVKRGLLQQKNRTRQYFYDQFSRIIDAEKTPPYLWKEDPNEKIKVKNGLFWWLQNPAGKILFDKDTLHTNLFTVVFKSYSLKAAYDITRISAELHLNYKAGIPVQEILNSLDTYRTWVDPCSGKPYIWNEQNQVLYSIGTDRDDDGGRFTLSSIDTDFTLPVILYIKNDA